MISPVARVTAAVLAGSGLAQAAYSIGNNAEIKQSAKQLAADLIANYHGDEPGQTPGILPGPPPAGDYYWWEAGAMWGTYIDYWYWTGDDTYNNVTTQAMLFQVGPDRDYKPPNVTASLGNDDQGFWGMSAMSAAENNFPNPPEDQPQWLALAQAVFNTQAATTVDDNTCGGGLRWQIPPTNNGYDYKNSIANGCFFNLGARLARYTDNHTYADWAEKTWDWESSTGLIDAKYNVFDGAHVGTNCTDINRATFSYNSAIYLLGAAYMYNYTDGSEKWKERVSGLVDRTIATFFPDGIAYEVSCEKHNTCTTDMLSFKGYVHRWMSTTTQIAPFTREKILPTLQTSTAAAISQCTGGSTGRVCGFKWTTKEYDGTQGVGQTMDVMAAVSSLLIESAAAPVTNATGGSSIGNPNAGTGGDSVDTKRNPISTGDKAGAGILTFVVLVTAVGTFGWMSTGV